MNGYSKLDLGLPLLQRLASIVIRLALAEVFCAECGILALDEPTASLDDANTEALTNALVQLIERKQNQKGIDEHHTYL